MYHQQIARSISRYQVNIVIKILIISDFLVWSANQLLAPIFAIFVTDQIAGGTIEAAGIASALYLVFKSLFEIPVGIYIDRTTSEKDDLWCAVIGTTLTALLFFGYSFIHTVNGVYIIQALLGITSAISFPGWYSIFTRHIDREKAGFEWSVYDVFLGLGMAAAAALSGFFADRFGFSSLFILLGIFTLLGSFMLIMIKNKIYTK
ncbi:MAG: MFS transporter [Patescibacteria group bacterium]